MAATGVDGAELDALALKYETLASLRRARDRGEPPPAKAELQALAARFPGSLFELDTLALDVIDARAQALREAARGFGAGETPPWMIWMSRYHTLVREELASRRLSRSPLGPRVRATSTAIATIAREAKATPAVVEAALFARRRRGVTR